MKNIRTDLALEAREIYKEAEKSDDEIQGVEAYEENGDQFKITRVKITSEEGEKLLGKKTGTYITIESPSLRHCDPEIAEKITQVLKKELSSLAGEKPDSPVLVAGLGNSRITSDSLGPMTVSNLVVTRHLLSELSREASKNLSSVCAISPGVLGITGIETSEIISSVSENIKPKLLIVIDALASRRAERVSTTIQITDTGICPGSGVGNHRAAINSETLGMPVIAIGVPTVVDASVLAEDASSAVYDMLLSKIPENSAAYNSISEMRSEKSEGFYDNMLKTEPFFVTPKEIDSISERISKIIADGINTFLHPGITKEEIEIFTS